MDIILGILLAIGFLLGVKSGAVAQFVSLVSFLLGLFVACLYYKPLAVVMCCVLPVPGLCQVVAFLLLWIVIPLVAKYAVELLTSLFDKLIVVGLLNRFLGGLFGLLKFGLLLGAVLWLATKTGMVEAETVCQSRIGAILVTVPRSVCHILS